MLIGLFFLIGMESGYLMKCMNGIIYIQKNAKANLKELINNFDSRLEQYSEIWFYYNPGRFHPLYQELIINSMLNNKIYKFSHINEIV